MKSRKQSREGKMLYRWRDFAVFLTIVINLHIDPCSGLQCQLPEFTGAAADYLSICAMCSDSDAAVRWTVREDGNFLVLLMAYRCYDENRSIIYESENDGCFTPYPNWLRSKTGTSGVGRDLRPGLQCSFRAAYRINGVSLMKQASCIIKSTEFCEEFPEDCEINRQSSLNASGKCDVNCAPGYEGDLCNNVNECSLRQVCGENATCLDTDGSYLCQYQPGFQGNETNSSNVSQCAGSHSCNTTSLTADTDVVDTRQFRREFQVDGYMNECEGDNKCHENAECHITDGGYWCECLLGFQGDGYTCTDVNECTEADLVKCGDNAQCVNTNGSFRCECLEGFLGNGLNCTAVDSTPSDHVDTACDKNALMTNYICTCKLGFTGDGYNCTETLNGRLLIACSALLIMVISTLCVLSLLLIHQNSWKSILTDNSKEINVHTNHLLVEAGSYNEMQNHSKENDVMELQLPTRQVCLTQGGNEE